MEVNRMKKKIKVTVEGVGEILTEEDIKLEELSKQVFGKDYRKYIGARINNEIYHLRKSIEENMYIKFLSLKDEDGHKIYARTATAIFIMACKEIFPRSTVKIEHSIGEGLYAELE